MSGSPEQYSEMQHEMTSADVRIRHGIEEVYQLLGQASDKDSEGVIGEIRDYVQPGGFVEQELEVLDASRREALRQKINLGQKIDEVNPLQLRRTIDAIERDIQDAIKKSSQDFLAIAAEKIKERDVHAEELSRVSVLKNDVDQVGERLLAIDTRIASLADEIDTLKGHVPELLVIAERYRSVRESVKGALGSIALSDRNLQWKKAAPEVVSSEVKNDNFAIEVIDLPSEIPKLRLDIPAGVLSSVQSSSNLVSKERHA